MRIMINGQATQMTQAQVSIFSEGLQYGFGIFETLKVEQQKVYRLSDHLERMFSSAQFLDLKIDFTANQISSQIQTIITDCKSLATAKLKIIAIPQKLILIYESLNPQNIKTAKLKSLQISRPLPQIKAISYLASYYAHRQARQAGFYDSLLLNEQNQVTEGAYCNIFWVSKGQIFTRAQQVLPGITRKAVIEISPIPIQFQNIAFEQILQADEVFLSQSLGGIIPVTQIDQQQIGQGQAGEVSQLIQVAYLKDRQARSQQLTS